MSTMSRRKNRFIATAGTALVAGVAALSAAPAASASTQGEYCRVVADAYQYSSVTSDNVGHGYQVTLHPGNIYHLLSVKSVGFNTWYYGHDSEYPNTNGYVVADHTDCP